MKKDVVSFLDFQKLDLRIGEVKEAAFVEGSRNLIAMKVNLGEEYGTVEIMAGIGDVYKAEEILGKKFIFVTNLEPKKMLDRYSNGMILAADIDGKATIIPVSNELKNGSIVR